MFNKAKGTKGDSDHNTNATDVALTFLLVLTIASIVMSLVFNIWKVTI